MANEDEKPLTLKDVQELQGQLTDMASRLEKSSSAATSTPGATPQGTARVVDGPVVDSYSKTMELRRELLENYDERQLHRMIGMQMRKGAEEGIGLNFDTWASQNTKDAIAASNPMVTKLLDTAGGVALIRQDLEPLLYAAFVKRFPLYERINKKPSNGLVHAFNRIDALPIASFLTDTGTVADSVSTYTRSTTNVAIIALRVGTSLRAQFAINAGGGGYDAGQEEIRNAMYAIAKKCQATFFHGNDSVPGKLDTDPEGLFDPLGFNGLRVQMPSGNTLAVETSTMLEKLNNADKLLSVTGGAATIVVMDGRDRISLMNELQPAVRYIDRMPLVPGLPPVEAVNLGNSGTIPVLGVPGDEIGAYTVGADSVRDIYLLDEDVIAAPWLGSESPTVLEIPVGVSGALTKLYIIFLMIGLENAVPKFSAKVRLKVG